MGEPSAAACVIPSCVRPSRASSVAATSSRSTGSKTRPPFWWAAGNKSMPEYPHLILEDCTMVHPDNALAMSYASHCVRAKLIGCRLIALNFTQPGMSKEPRAATGIIGTERYPHHGTEPRSAGQRLHVDLEDCILAGYSIFTPGNDSEAVSYSTKGKVQAYVQFEQTVPEGFERLGLWPAELFDRIAPAATADETVTAAESGDHRQRVRFPFRSFAVRRFVAALQKGKPATVETAAAIRYNAAR